MSRLYETAIAITASISKAFKADAKGASEAIKRLADTTKQLKSAEKSAASLKKLDGELARSKSRYDTATAALRKLEEAERAAGGATKESTRWRKAGAREVASAARQLDRATKAAQKHTETLHKLGVDTNKLTSEQERLTRALAATERQEKSLERFEHSRERLFGKRREKTPLLEKGKEQFKGIGETVLHLAEGALVAGEAMHLLVDKTMHAGAEVGESAEKLGIGAKALQELRYGARQSGAEVEDLDRALAKMAVNIGKHKQMKGKGGAAAFSIPGLQGLDKVSLTAAGAVDPFKQIGLKAKDLATLKPEEQLKKIADGMLKLKTHADKAAVAQEIFGKGATALLPYLSEGSEGIEKLAASANKYGGVLSEESIHAAIEAEKASKDMNLALGGLANTLGAVLLPTAVKAFKGISAWVGENRESIKKWSEGAAKWIEDKGLPALKHIVAEVQGFGSKVLWLVNGAAKLTGGFGNLALVVAGIRLAPFALTLTKIGIEAGKAAAALLRYVSASASAKAAGADVPGGAGGAAGGGGGGAGAAVKALPLIGTAIAIERTVKAAADNVEVASGIKLGDISSTSGFGIDKAKLTALLVEQARAARERAEASVAPVPVTGGAGGGTTVAPVITIGAVKGREEVAAGMDAAKDKVLEAYDKREAHRRRVSFGR